MTDDLFAEFISEIQFDLSEFLVLSDLNDFQKKAVENATFIMKENIVGDVKEFGGNFNKNKAKFDEFAKQTTEKAEKAEKDEKYKEIKKDLKDFVKNYLNALRELLGKTCLAIIPVKEMPWEDIIFRTIPRLKYDKKKVSVVDSAIAYYGEIKCVISRTTIYGEMKEAKPLFAPFIGELDLQGFTLDDAQKKGKKSMIFPYVSAIIQSLDSQTSRAQLAKYHEGYQRHGEPICDFLMKDEELMKSMGRITSAIKTKRLKTEMAVCGIAIPISDDRTSLMLVTEESKDSDKCAKCFEGVLRFSAACCEAPSTKSGDKSQEAAQMTQAAQAQAPPSGPGVGGLVGFPAPAAVAPPQVAQAGGSIQTPGGQELKVWSADELAEAAQQRGGGTPPGMATWSEEDLAKAASERGTGIPDGMEVWSEEDLEELAKKRQAGLDIPAWEEDKTLLSCSKCGYSLRKGWSECPICETPVGAAPAQASAPAPANPVEADKKEENKPAEKKDDAASAAEPPKE